MALRTQQFTFTPAGMRPRQYVVERLARYHPSVKLVWNVAVMRWQLIERNLRTGQWMNVAILQGPDGEYLNPTLWNTVDHLNKIDVRNLGYWDIKRLAEQGTESEIQFREAREKGFDDFCRSASEQIADMIWHDQKKRISVVKPHASNGQQARRQDPRQD